MSLCLGYYYKLDLKDTFVVSGFLDKFSVSVMSCFA